MDYRASETDLMAYLYGELEGQEKETLEQYLLENAEARAQLESLKQIKFALSHVKDKEVIAPPIFVGESNQRYFWNTPYFKTIVSIAASVLIIMMVGKVSGLQVRYSDSELKISFGGVTEPKRIETAQPNPALTPTEVKDMINTALHENNSAMQATWTEHNKSWMRRSRRT